MPAPDRFSSQNMADCEFCPRDGRRFRTARQCAQCGKALCIVCRPQVPQIAFLCPECGGGPRDDALKDPGAVIRRLTDGGLTPPYWLVLLEERLAATPSRDAEEIIVPE